MGVSGRCGSDTSVAVVVQCFNGWYGRLARLLRLDSAATDAAAFLVAAPPIASPVTQAVAAVTIKIEIIN